VAFGDPMNPDVSVNGDYVRARYTQVCRATFGRLTISGGEDQRCAGICEKSSTDPPDSAAGARHQNYTASEVATRGAYRSRV
jgi:hypothetical protein